MFTINSYAKINLSLNVTGVRNDGYHTLRSVISYIDLYDVIRIQENNSHNTKLFISGMFGGHFNNNDKDQISNNIISKSLNYLKEKYNISIGFDIFLEKNIPIASGMGGGSSNAASIIRFCNEYFNLRLSEQEMMKDGVNIGADVPFFINNKIALCEGIGEIVTPLNVEEGFAYVLVVNPMIEVKSIDVYKRLNYRSKSRSGLNDTLDGLMKSDLISIDELLYFVNFSDNDLLRPASEIAPTILDILDDMDDMSAPIVSKMSGSGSTCFSIYKDSYVARNALYHIRELHPNAFAGVFRLLTNVNQVILQNESHNSKEKFNLMVS